jgi:hypothetical protein
MEPENSLQRSQEFTAGPKAEPDESSLHIHTLRWGSHGSEDASCR